MGAGAAASRSSAYAWREIAADEAARDHFNEVPDMPVPAEDPFDEDEFRAQLDAVPSRSDLLALVSSLSERLAGAEKQNQELGDAVWDSRSREINRLRAVQIAVESERASRSMRSEAAEHRANAEELELQRQMHEEYMHLQAEWRRRQEAKQLEQRAARAQLSANRVASAGVAATTCTSTLGDTTASAASTVLDGPTRAAPIERAAGSTADAASAPPSLAQLAAATVLTCEQLRDRYGPSTGIASLPSPQPPPASTRRYVSQPSAAAKPTAHDDEAPPSSPPSTRASASGRHRRAAPAEPSSPPPRMKMPSATATPTSLTPPVLAGAPLSTASTPVHAARREPPAASLLAHVPAPLAPGEQAAFLGVASELRAEVARRGSSTSRARTPRALRCGHARLSWRSLMPSVPRPTHGAWPPMRRARSIGCAPRSRRSGARRELEPRMSRRGRAGGPGGARRVPPAGARQVGGRAAARRARAHRGHACSARRCGRRELELRGARSRAVDGAHRAATKTLSASSARRTPLEEHFEMLERSVEMSWIAREDATPLSS